jgi:GDPmannose 4,6-dehydratase
MTRRALITGITGQDGSYLAELLLAKGYEVHGLARRTSHSTMPRIDHLYHELHARDEHVMVHYGDITDGLGVLRLVLDIEPDEIYNLAAQSHVRISFDSPAATVQSVAVGALHVLEAARQLQRRKEVRVYQASSSEMFGDAVETPQRESTAFRPQSPYACGKVYAHFQAVNYRRAYDLFACTGILFNHESPRRDESFVTRKITRAATRIKLGLQDKLYLGNLDAERDWGYARDYVEAMWLITQHERPDDFVIATGRTHSIRQFLEQTFGYLDLNWQQHVEIDPQYLRPAEVRSLRGDATKARQQLGWQPETSFEQLIRLMVDADLQLAQHEKPPHS